MCYYCRARARWIIYRCGRARAESADARVEGGRSINTGERGGLFVIFTGVDLDCEGVEGGESFF